MTNKLLVICGPNATGKSDLAIKLAKKINGEVISADSRQVYKGLNIGSGKITHEEQQGISHYLLDVANPKKRFTVAQYYLLVKKAIKKILGKGKLPILCGGTGFYIQVVVDNLSLPAVPPDWKLRGELEHYDIQVLQKELKKVDRKRWERMNESDRNNSRRLVRALEIVYKTGTNIPSLKRKTPPFNLLMIGITAPLEVLKGRIKTRLLKRFENGMIDEVRRLYDSGIAWKRLEELGLEYRWITYFLQKKISYEEMLERLYLDIVAYARRQLTWFKKDKRICWFDISQPKWENEVEKLVSVWMKKK